MLFKLIEENEDFFENAMEILDCESLTETYITIGVLGGFAMYTLVQIINVLVWAF